jgi:putative ABC transport system permease protein
MFKIILKSAYRNFKKNRIVSLINILGLSLGIAVCIIIYQYVSFELSYDKFHEDSELLYRIERDPFAGIAPSFVPLMKEDFPEVNKIARMTAGWNMTVKNEQYVYNEDHVCFAEPSVLDIFSFHFIEGNPEKALDAGNVILTKTTAQKYFGNQNPVGKKLVFDDTENFTVSAVIEDIPENSHLVCDFLCSYLSLRDYNVPVEDDYFLGNTNFSDNVVLAYARMHPNSDIETFKSKLPEFVDRHVAPNKNEAGVETKASSYTRFTVRKVEDIHLHSHKINEVRTNGDIGYIYLFAVLALLIIVIACINFFNLSTATINSRLTETGIKKVFGISRKSIYAQFIFESLLLVLIATLFAAGLNFMALPWLKSFLGYNDNVQLIPTANLFLVMLLLVIFLSLVTGLVPGKYLSKQKIIGILRSKTSGRAGGNQYRHVLVVFQFVVAIVLFIAIGTIYRQMEFLNRKELGFSKENIILIPSDDKIRENWNSIRQQLVNHSSVSQASLSKSTLGGRLTDAPGLSIIIDGEWKNWPEKIPHIRTGFNFFNTYEIPVLAGRDFDSERPTDWEQAFILNETAARQMGFDNYIDIIGKQVRTGSKNQRTGKVIGVVKDFHYESLHSKILPMVTYISLNSTYTISVKVSNVSDETIAHIRNVLAGYHSDYDFTYTFFEDRLAGQYMNEKKMMTLTAFASLFAIFIAGLGLLGLSLYTAKNRNKEIGIRKVNGARISEVLFLLNKDFLKWVAIAFVIATPIAYYAMNKWLENFAYKTNLSWWIFALAGLLALGIALLTVSWQSWKAATRNPVEALRYE